MASAKSLTWLFPLLSGTQQRAVSDHTSKLQPTRDGCCLPLGLEISVTTWCLWQNAFVPTNSFFKPRGVLDNYPDPVAVASEHLHILMAFPLPMFMPFLLTVCTEIGAEREKNATQGTEIEPEYEGFLTLSLKSALCSFPELNYIKHGQNVTTNRLLAWQSWLRDQNRKCSADHSYFLIRHNVM